MGLNRNLIILLLLLPCWALKTHAQPRNGMERLVEKFYSIMEGDSLKPKKNYLFAIPIWAVTPETGIKLGVSVGYIFRTHRDSVTRPSLIRLNTSYTQMGQFNIRPTIDVFFPHNMYNLKAQYVYNDFNEYYWGIGNTAPETAKELYDFQQHKAYLKFTRQFLHGWYAGPSLQYEKLYDTHFKNGSITPQSNVAGINGYTCFGPGFLIAYDTRKNIYYPMQGSYAEINAVYYIKTGFSNYAFNSYTLDLRKYIGLWKKNVFAMQAFGSFNTGNVPYRQMGTIGSEFYMRGYYMGRFRDLHMAAVQAELRKTIWGPVSMAFFAGAGNVGNSGADVFSGIKPTYGFGFRGTTIRKENVNVRMDFGFGQGKIKGFYFTMGEAF